MKMESGGERLDVSKIGLEIFSLLANTKLFFLLFPSSFRMDSGGEFGKKRKHSRFSNFLETENEF